WPKFKWRTTIDLVDGMGKSIASTEHVRENGGIRYQGYRQEFDHNIHFSLGPWDDVLQEQAKTISVKYERVSEEIATTPDAWIESSKLEVVHGRVTDADGRPVANAGVQIREKRKKGQKGIAAPDLCTDGQGFYSFDEIRWPYRVSAIVYDQDPSSQDYSHQFKRLNRTLHGTQKIDFKFEEFPQGTAVLTGQIVKPDGSAATEFTVDVRNEVDWKDYSDQYLHVFGFKKYFVSPDSRFEISGLASGIFSIRINLTGKESEDVEFNLRYTRQVCELMDGKITEVTNEMVVKKVVKPVLDERVYYYGQILYENGKPAVLPTSPWKGAKVYVELRSTPTTSLGVEGIVDNQGYFAILLTDKQFEKITTDEYSIKIYYPSCQDEFTSYTIGTFPVEMLTQNRDTSKGYRLPPDGMSVEFENLEQILKSYDILHELGSVLLKWSGKHSGRFPANLNLNEVVSFADTETLTWIMENVEYWAGRRTGHEVEIFPVAYDKTLLENINGTHVLFSNGDVKFLRRREVEIIDSY
ncbi:carboxypeptidase regulatory-like domain-containing protein, partial [bacterium]|nr:carboxypeptidase regulatory-like domain-containing protein [bacterium]